MTDKNLDSCPCGSLEPYLNCCGQYIERAAVPASAEQLMRSRYSAYVLQREPYLLQTWHPSTRPAQLGLQATPPVKWLGLKINSASQIDAHHAEVNFVARFTLNGKAKRLAESSRFIKEDGKWFYIDGLVLP